VHTRFAEAIDADPSLVPPHRAPIETAHHWYSAQNVTWALVSAWHAAAQAAKVVAHAERLTLLARVLELWDQVPDAAERIGAGHVRVLEEAVQAADDADEHGASLHVVAGLIAVAPGTAGYGGRVGRGRPGGPGLRPLQGPEPPAAGRAGDRTAAGGARRDGRGRRRR
jgi:hypothetical protein